MITFPAGWSRVQRSIAVSVTGTLLVATVAALAVRSPGYTQANVDLSASTVWTTNDTEAVVGRVNLQIGQLNSSFKSEPDFDVLQGDGQVFAVDRSGNLIKTVDQAAVTTGAALGIPKGASLGYGDGILSIVDPVTGRWWAGTPDGLSGLDPAVTPALLTTAPQAVTTVSHGGTAFTVAAGSDKLWSLAFGPDGLPVDRPMDKAGRVIPPAPSTLAGGALSAAPLTGVGGISITAVGDVPVVLDSRAGQLIFAGHRIAVADASDAVLQQPGAAADSVLVETRSALREYPLDGGPPKTLFDNGNGPAVPPVWLDGCAWAAWNGPATLEALSCNGNTTRTVTLPGAGRRDPVFRVNGHAIVLNDRISGTIWALDKNLTVTVIDNWDQVKPEDQSQTTDNSDGSKTRSSEIAASRADCTKAGPSPSTAAEAKFAVRAGRSTVLPILDDVTAGDCAAVVVSGVSALPAADGAVDVVHSGQAVQVTVPAGASGPLPTLTYTIDDGVNPAVQATLSITVAPAGAVGDVKKQRDSSTEVEINGSIGYDVLPDYYSTTGDDLYLTSATATTAGDSVDYTPGGQITFHDKGSSGTGHHEVLFTITDGKVVRSGKLTVDVKPDGNARPIASAVVAESLSGVPITVRPLSSVLSPGIDPLRLTAVAARGAGGGATADLDTDDDTVVLQSAAPGTYYFTYSVVAGAGKSTGVLRFDVRPRPTKPAPPVATADVVYLPEGDSVRVDPTANDLDPNGSGLAIAQVGADSTGTLTVTDTAMQTLQITARGILPAAAVVPYVVSNGVATANGQIRVIPVPALQDPPAPTATPISLTVRAGDALTLPVARFASDPRGESLTPSIVSGAGATVPGVLFANATEIRYLAPITPPAGPVQFSYSVTNTSGQVSPAATVTLTVAPRDPSVDSAPNTPATVIGRVLTGRSITVDLPLEGIDPDGDWVSLTKVSAPSSGLGTATVTGLSSITFNALTKPGISTVTYTVADPYGKPATGTVTMIVVRSPNVVQPPVAPNLVASMRPGKAVSVRPLESGVVGENVRLAPPAIDQVAGWQAVGDGDALLISAPGKAAGVAAFTYHVVDDRGQTAGGVITVTISPTAPLVPPIAQDVIVTSSMVKDKLNATVDVGGSIQNNSGRTADLVVGVTNGEPATPTGRDTFRIPLTPYRQVLAYTASDTQGQVAKAFIVVPSKSDLVVTPPPPTPQKRPDQPDQPPVPKQTLPTITVRAGATASGQISDYVDVPAGRTVQIPVGPAPTATQGTGRRVDPGTFTYTADQTGSGPDVLTVMVSDGTSAAIAVSVPIIIIPITPVLNSTSLDVEVGLSGAVDLVSLISPSDYPDTRKLKFSNTAVGNGFTASLAGTRLTVAVSNSVRKGATVQVPISATDSAGVTVTAAVAVTATGTTKPLPTVGDQTLVGRPGVATGFSVLDGSSDPYGAGLTVLPSPKLLQGKGSAVVSGSRLLVTPAAGQIGDVVFRFTVADGTRDPSRYVSGQVTLTVKDKPHAPGQPIPVPNSATAASVTLTWEWQPGWVNGGTVQPFVVSAPGLADTTCPSSNCQIGGLTPGRSYLFTVSVTNEDGTSRSTPSAPITPDARPPAPSAPSVVLTGDKQLTVKWTIAKDDRSYSPITTAIVTEVIRGGDQPPIDIAHSGPGQQVFDRLDIAATYSFYLTVTNNKGTARSAASAPQHPNTTPGPPTAVSMAFNPSPRSLTVSWTPPAPSAQRPAPLGYAVTYTGGGSAKTITAPGNATSVTIPGPVDGASYTVTQVIANNKWGSGDPSGGSGNGVVPFSRPTTVSAVTATPTGADNSVRLDNVQGGRSSGRQGGDFYSTGFGNWKAFSPGSDTVTTDSNGSVLVNGTQYTFQVRVCYPPENPYTDAMLCGDPTGAAASPYGPVGPPGVLRQTGQSATQIRFAWSPPADNGRGPIKTRYSVDGGALVPFGQGAASQAVGAWTCGTTHTMSVQAFDTAGHAGPASAPVTGSTSACPPPGAPVNVRQAGNSQTQIRFNWSPPGSNGKPPITTQYSVDGGGYTGAFPGDASVVVGSNWACATSHTITVHATDGAGQVGAAASVSGSTAACPVVAPPVPQTSIQAYIFGDANGHDAGSPWSTRCVSQNTHTCHYIGVRLSNFPAGSTQSCLFLSGSSTRITTDGSGNGDAQPGWYSGEETATVTCGQYSSTVTW